MVGLDRDLEEGADERRDVRLVGTEHGHVAALERAHGAGGLEFALA